MNSDAIKRPGKHIYSDDLVLDKPYRRGDTGQKVVLIQEWLCLHDIHVLTDGIFGPATQKAVRIYQRKKGLDDEGIVENATFAELIKPMTEALLFEARYKDPLAKIVVDCAKTHLKQHPREIGGSNLGPWVRLYLDGRQGVPWCAGFVSFIVRETAFSIGEIPPLETFFSCDLLAKSAKSKNIFLDGRDKAGRSKVRPGALFICRKSDSHWAHTGIVTKIDSEFFRSIEGNSPADGGEVCERLRGYDNKDFILI